MHGKTIYSLYIDKISYNHEHNRTSYCKTYIDFMKVERKKAITRHILMKNEHRKKNRNSH